MPASEFPESAQDESARQPGACSEEAGQYASRVAGHRPLRFVEDREVLDSRAMDEQSPDLGSVREHYLFAGLGQEEFDRLMRRSTRVVLDKGEVLFHRGDNANHFYYVEAGQVELSLIAATGQKKVLEVLGSGRTFAEAITFMREHKYPVTCEALADSIVRQIPNQDYIELVSSNSEACLRLLSDISRHLHARVREIERLTIQNARGRLVSYLLDHIVEVDDDEATIRLGLPRHVIASRLSMSPETLSRLLRGLVDEGILTIEDRVIFVHSLSRLRPYD
ncbi:MAG: Crp/Fnr family transcriptional regulator [Gammaproteobacteria bacterium]|nr:Crp/Fnr family transcriptional regulator [Gammaproteobacteria bacterium]MDH5311629.1 Crp/Fnr family transcriptional regulator [Gammaproteobacteria bacterium]